LAIKRGYFAFPGSPRIHKSYGYIYGFLDSIDFTIDSNDEFCCYNYAEYPTQSLRELVEEIKEYLDTRALVLSIPLWLLMPIARTVQAVFGFKNPVHPVRVKKAATPTHIIPGVLRDSRFPFRYSFRESLAHWQSTSPEDFGPVSEHANTRKSRVVLGMRRSAEVKTSHQLSERFPQLDIQHFEEQVK
jgi:hypothetical protein